MALVLVTGGSRGVGRETVRAALRAGHDVRAMSRSRPDDAETRAYWIVGDATDIRTLKAAVAGVNAVITCLGHPPSLAPVRLFSRAAGVLTDVMRELSVQRLIAVTGLGTGDSRDIGPSIVTTFLRPLLLGQIYADKAREESVIRNSGREWTIVRPGILTRLPPSGYRVLATRSEWEPGFISRADLAAFLVTQIEDRSLIGQTPVLVGN